MTRYSRRTRENAALQAAKRLRLHGINYLCGHMLLTHPDEQAIAWLADISEHIDSLDPIAIGAGAVREAQGYERTNVQLTLSLEGDTP